MSAADAAAGARRLVARAARPAVTKAYGWAPPPVVARWAEQGPVVEGVPAVMDPMSGIATFDVPASPHAGDTERPEPVDRPRRFETVGPRAAAPPQGVPGPLSVRPATAGAALPLALPPAGTRLPAFDDSRVGAPGGAESQLVERGEAMPVLRPPGPGGPGAGPPLAGQSEAWRSGAEQVERGGVKPAGRRGAEPAGRRGAEVVGRREAPGPSNAGRSETGMVGTEAARGGPREAPTVVIHRIDVITPAAPSPRPDPLASLGEPRRGTGRRVGAR
jgi:hypothetical protein